MTACIPHRVVTPETLAALKKTHPIEGAACEILIERGVWTLKTENEVAV